MQLEPGIDLSVIVEWFLYNETTYYFDRSKNYVHIREKYEILR